MRINFSMTFLAVAISVLSQDMHSEVIYRPSQLNANKDVMDRQQVTVIGWLIAGREKFGNEFGIWDEKIKHQENSDPESCVSIYIRSADLPEVAKYTNTTVIISGEFRRSFEIDERIWVNGACNVTGIVFPAGGTVRRP